MQIIPSLRSCRYPLLRNPRPLITHCSLMSNIQLKGNLLRKALRKSPLTQFNSISNLAVRHTKPSACRLHASQHRYTSAPITFVDDSVTARYQRIGCTWVVPECTITKKILYILTLWVFRGQVPKMGDKVQTKFLLFNIKINNT